MPKGRPSSSASNRSLTQARAAKQDEFYTQLNDISNELKHYKSHLHDKVVLCNCDDPYESNFFKYFALNFNSLGLKKLIATSYQPSPIVGGQLPLLEIEGLKPSGKEPYAVEINEVKDLTRDGAIGIKDIELLLRSDANVTRPLNSDDTFGGGDFRSRECLQLLEQADIVITNPPFSLFREYVSQLSNYNKDFLIIGPKTAITAIEVISQIRDNKLWLGTGFASGNAYFEIPRENEREYAPGVFNPETGLVKFRNVCWYTTLDHKRRHEEIPLFRRYEESEYPEYDLYKAIDVSKVANIPLDYDGAMGVPITFLDRYNPSQFEILNANNLRKSTSVPAKPHGLIKDTHGSLQGKRKFVRLVIKRRK